MLRFRRCRQRSGMVLLVVIVASIVMSIFVILMLSQNLSQVTSSQDRVDQIKAQELAQGVYWKYYADLAATGSATVEPPVDVGGKTFTTSINGSGTAASPYTVRVDYP